MANNKSSKKSIKTNKRNKIKNNYYKGNIKSLTKLYFKSLDTFLLNSKKDSFIEAKKILKNIFSITDKAVKNKIIHKNKSLRKKIQLYILLKNTIN